MLKSCAVCGKEFDARGSTKTCGAECSRECGRRRVEEYRKSQSRREYMRQCKRQYRQSEAHKEYHRQYRQSDAYKEYQRQYWQSDAYKENQRRKRRRIAKERAFVERRRIAECIKEIVAEKSKEAANVE